MGSVAFTFEAMNVPYGAATTPDCCSASNKTDFSGRVGSRKVLLRPANEISRPPIDGAMVALPETLQIPGETFGDVRVLLAQLATR